MTKAKWVARDGEGIYSIWESKPEWHDGKNLWIFAIGNLFTNSVVLVPSDFYFFFSSMSLRKGEIREIESLEIKYKPVDKNKAEG